jgi:hypothetical protein
MNFYNESNCNKSLLFVVANSEGEMFEQIIQTMEGLRKCEKNKVNKLENFDVELLLIGIGILGSIFITTGIFLLTIDKDLNIIWKALFKRLKFSIYGVRQKVFERLSQHHDKAEYSDSDHENIKLIVKHNVKFRHSIRYLAYLSVLFIAAAGIYIVNSFVFDSLICKLLLLKPDVMADLWLKQINVQKLAFFTQENIVAPTPASFSELYKNQILIESPNPALISYSSLLHSPWLLYRKEYISDLISNALVSKLNSKIPSANNFLAYGIINSIDHLVQESLFLSFNPENSFTIYHSKIKLFATELSIILQEAASNSESSIAKYINYLIIFTVVSCIILVLLYIFISHSLLEKESKVVKGIMKLLTIIPNN